MRILILNPRPHSPLHSNKNFPLTRHSHLTPGGYFELAEAEFGPACGDGTMPDDWPPVVLFNHVRRALEQINRTRPTDATLRRYIEGAGSVDVKMKKFKLPVGTWPKKPALKQAAGLGVLAPDGGAYESYALQLCTTVLGMLAAPTNELCRRAREAYHAAQKTVHVYYSLYVFSRRAEVYLLTGGLARLFMDGSQSRGRVASDGSPPKGRAWLGE